MCARDLRLARLPAPSSSLRAGYEGVGAKLSSPNIITTKRRSLSNDIYSLSAFVCFFYSNYIWVLVFIYNRKLPLSSHVTAIVHKTLLSNECPVK